MKRKCSGNWKRKNEQNKKQRQQRKKQWKSQPKKKFSLFLKTNYIRKFRRRQKSWTKWMHNSMKQGVGEATKPNKNKCPKNTNKNHPGTRFIRGFFFAKIFTQILCAEYSPITRLGLNCWFPTICCCTWPNTDELLPTRTTTNWSRCSHIPCYWQIPSANSFSQFHWTNTCKLLNL